MARFIGKEDAIVFGMGFATNSTNLPVLVDKVRIHVCAQAPPPLPSPFPSSFVLWMALNVACFAVASIASWHPCRAAS